MQKLVSKIMFFSGAILLLATAPTAQLQAGEAAKLKCKTAYFNYGGSAKYACNGRYAYRHGGRVDRGTYSINGNRVCVRFVYGGSRCDTIVGNSLVNSHDQTFSFQLR